MKEPSARAPRRNAYEGKQRSVTASMAHWYDTIGTGAAGSSRSGIRTVVTAASARRFRSLLR
ncbi:Uncharacterised protein [Mycobacteroides abscessus subsp. abscessus]|nr:Uncharacterised protein [Mycobacteroides abscessus subsp. abscessus]SIM85719.1 Uncharacterised protein [Mycobacteroides abscessus subsp. abscessus]